jgi:hypothetical protein
MIPLTVISNLKNSPHVLRRFAPLSASSQHQMRLRASGVVEPMCVRVEQISGMKNNNGEAVPPASLTIIDHGGQHGE